MTSEERHELRYQRRKAMREEKRRKKSEACGSFEEVFSYENLYQAGTKCMRNVLWKASTQNYAKKRISTTYKIYETLQTDKLKLSKPYIFYVCERGKRRKKEKPESQLK